MRLCQLQLEDIFSRNFAEWDKANKIYALCGANYVKNYIFRKYGIKLKNAEIRTALARHLDPIVVHAQEAHSMAWTEAGWKAKEW